KSRSLCIGPPIFLRAQRVHRNRRTQHSRRDRAILGVLKVRARDKRPGKADRLGYRLVNLPNRENRESVWLLLCCAMLTPVIFFNRMLATDCNTRSSPST